MTQALNTIIVRVLVALGLLKLQTVGVSLEVSNTRKR